MDEVYTLWSYCFNFRTIIVVMKQAHQKSLVDGPVILRTLLTIKMHGVAWFKIQRIHLIGLDHKGKTPSKNTGPDRAVSGEYYIYLEASDPRKPGDQAL